MTIFCMIIRCGTTVPVADEQCVIRLFGGGSLGISGGILGNNVWMVQQIFPVRTVRLCRCHAE